MEMTSRIYKSKTNAHIRTHTYTQLGILCLYFRTSKKISQKQSQNYQKSKKCLLARERNHTVFKLLTRWYLKALKDINSFFKKITEHHILHTSKLSFEYLGQFNRFSERLLFSGTLGRHSVEVPLQEQM